MGNLQGFSFDGIEPEAERGPIPKGTYQAVATDSEMKQTRDGTGSYLSVTYEITGGAYSGRKIWHNFNLTNRNALAVEIGQKQLVSAATAAGIDPMRLKDSSDLHNKAVQIYVAVKEDATYGDKSEIKSFSKPFAGSAKPVGVKDPHSVPAAKPAAANALNPFAD